MRGLALLLLAQLAAAAEAVRVHSTGEGKAAATGTASRRVLQSDSEESVVGGSAGWGDWASQDDRVMGGVSVSTMVATSSDAIFSGNLRLDSNGGFASVSTSFRADVRAFGGLRVNFFPSSRRLLMYVNSSTLGTVRDLAISDSLSSTQVPPTHRCGDATIQRRDVHSIDQRGRRKFRTVLSPALDLVLSTGGPRFSFRVCDSVSPTSPI